MSINKIKEVKKSYDLEKIIFVGDRGIVTKSNKEKLEDEKDLHTISALTRSEIFDLLNRDVIQPELFDERKIHEAIDVEQAFRNLKTVQLEMRPIYHKRDDRIRAHVF